MKQKYIDVVSAKYLDAYKLEISFSDKEVRIVDFYEFLSNSTHPVERAYLRLENFKKFKIEDGHLTWGEDDDLIFPVADLYAGKIPA